MCNLTAYFGVKPMNTKDLKILTLMGDARGGDGVGIYYNRKKHSSLDYKYDNGYGYPMDIKKGIDYVDLIEEVTDGVVLLHHRKSSSGSRKATHPFVYLDKGGEIDMVFMHNGTIKNINLIHTEYKPDIAWNAIDSKIMGQIIYENGEKVCEKLFKDYSGGGNFIWYYPKHDVFYFYKGIDKDGKEERPLSFYQQNDCIYLTSLSRQLDTIGLESKILKCGDLYRCERNSQTMELQNILQIKRDRDVLRPKVVSLPATSSYSSTNRSSSNKELKNKFTNPQNLAKGKIYWYLGKYYKNGHLLNGIYDIDIFGKVNENNSGTYYFIDGLWIKDKYAYSRLVKKGSIMSMDLYPGTYKLQSKHIWGQKTIKNGYIQPPYSYFIYKIVDQQLTYEYPLPTYEELEAIELYNEWHGENFECIQECKDHFESEYETDFNIEYFQNETELNLIKQNKLMLEIEQLFTQVEDTINLLEQTDTNGMSDEEIEQITKLRAIYKIINKKELQSWE